MIQADVNGLPNLLIQLLNTHKKTEHKTVQQNTSNEMSAKTCCVVLVLFSTSIILQTPVIISLPCEPN